jgi:hypothetical protein
VPTRTLDCQSGVGRLRNQPAAFPGAQSSSSRGHGEPHKKVCHCLEFLAAQTNEPGSDRAGLFILHPFYSYVARQLRQRRQDEVSPEKYSHDAHDVAKNDKGVQNLSESCHFRNITITSAAGYRVFTVGVLGVCPILMFGAQNLSASADPHPSLIATLGNRNIISAAAHS